MGIAIAGVAVVRVWSSRTSSAARHAAVGPLGGLAPTADAVRYRFSITAQPDPRIELDGGIKAMKARVESGKQPFDMTELAEMYYARGQLGGLLEDYAAAESVAKQSLALLPEPNGATLTLAKVANARHEFRDAIRLAESFKKRTAGVPTIIATAYLALGELPAAARAAQQAVMIKPDSGTYLTRALVMQAQGRDEEAETDFAAAAHSEEHGDIPGAAKLRALWGRFLLRRGELDGAAMVIDEALRIAPDHALAQAQKAELLLRRGQAKAAAALFEQAFASSRQVRYLMDQARAEELAGQKAAADTLRAQVETIVRAELGEGGLGHKLDLVEVLIDRGNTQRITEAMALATDEVDKRPSADTLFQLARAKAWANQMEGAQVDLAAALATGARDARFYELAARIEHKRGNAVRAGLYTRLAAELDPAGSSGAPSWRTLGMP